MIPRPNLGGNSMNSLPPIHSVETYSQEHVYHTQQGESNKKLHCGAGHLFP